MDRLSPDALSAVGAPPAPRTLADTGLQEPFFIALLLRHLFAGGEQRGGDLAARLHLPLAVLDPALSFLRAERLVEVLRRGSFDADVVWGLTDAGKARAGEAMERCRYVGPAPVTLADYCARVQAQSQRTQRVDAAGLRAALGSAVIADETLADIGAALNSDRALFIYGPAGTGKTYLAERFGGVLTGAIWVPHAVVVDGDVIQVFDPMTHRPVEQPVGGASLERVSPGDARWVRVRRPVTIVGGELTLEMLELQFEQVSRFYVAPPQMKANNGMLVIDDLGRQRVTPRELMNRWIVPLSRQVDYLALHTGTKFVMPFDVKVVFSSNLSPDALGDPAFARRLGYKLRLGAMHASDYREVIRQACERAGVAYHDAGAEHLMDGLHRRLRMPFYATVAHDVIGKLRDRAAFRGVEPVLDPEGLDWAWGVYFATDAPTDDESTLDELR